MKTIKRIAAFPMMILLVMAFTKCDPKQKTDDSDKVSNELKAQKLEVKESLNEMIEVIDNEINKIEANVEDFSDDARTKWDETLSDLKSTKADLMKKRDEVDNKTATDWKKFKENVDEGIDDIKIEIDKVGDDISEAFKK